jgi:hypothetical protein
MTGHWYAISDATLEDYLMRGKSPELNTTLLIQSFVRSAAISNLIVATLVFLEFTCMALFQHDPKTFQIGLWLIPYVTVVIWGSATVIFSLMVVANGFRTVVPWLLERSRISRTARSGVWDYCLDGPESHVR